MKEIETEMEELITPEEKAEMRYGELPSFIKRKPETLRESGEAAKRASEQLNRDMNASKKSDNDGQNQQCLEKGFNRRFDDER